MLELRRNRLPRPIYWLALLLLVAGLSAWAWSRSRSRDAEDVAAMYRAGRHEAARARLERWLGRAPSSAEAHLWKARLALAGRRPGEAAESLEQARRLGSPRDELDVLRAIAAALRGRFTESEPLLRQAFNARREPDPLLDEALSKIYLETYDLTRARVVLDRWILHAPADPKPYLWRAEVDTRTGDAASALANYREALRRDPRSARAQLGLAEELRKAHQNAEASDAFVAYLTQKPDDPAGHLGAGRNAAESGDADEAVRHIERALKLAPDDPNAHRELAAVLARRREFGPALEHLDRAEALDPFDMEIRHARALVLSQLGRSDEAKAEQSKAARLRDEQAALFDAQSRLVRAPTDLEAKLTITRWMFSHGKAAEAIRWAETILREQPGQPDASGMLTAHYERIGQPGLANFYRSQTASASAPGPREAPR